MSVLQEAPPLSAAVILVDFNGHDDTLACLRGLGGSPAGCRVVVVDNGSTEPLDIAGNADVEVLRSPKNLGFGGGNNLALRKVLQTPVRHVVLLNNDARMTWDQVRALVARLEKDPGLGCIGPVVVYEDGRFQSAGGWFEPTLWSKDAAAPPADGRIDYLQGCCLVFPAAVLRQTGGFDEAFFMYGEDKDLCLRVTRAGLRIAVDPTMSLVHLKARSASRDAGSKLFHFTRSNVLLRRKWLRGGLRRRSLRQFLARTARVRILRHAEDRTRQNLSAFVAGVRHGLRDPLDAPGPATWPYRNRSRKA